MMQGRQLKVAVEARRARGARLGVDSVAHTGAVAVRPDDGAEGKLQGLSRRMLQDKHGTFGGERLCRRRGLDPSAFRCPGTARRTADRLLTGLTGETEDRVVELILLG